MAQKIHETLVGRESSPHRNVLKYSTACAALAASLLSSPAFAQGPSAAPAGGTAAPASAGSAAPATREGPVTPPAAQVGNSSFVDSLIPGFQLAASARLDETYSTNSFGYSNGNSGDDWITMAGLNLGLNEHSARVSLDANYTGLVNYYARGTQKTQFTNELQAVGNVIAIPDYVNIIGRAFAQPVVISNVGPATASGVSANGFRNSYGYNVGPDITFHLGNFADSETNASYGAAYYTNYAGSSGFTGIPGIPGPQNTQMRSASERLTSGTDFSRLSWTLMGTFNETDRPQGLFSSKSGTGTLRYAITPEIALLGTGGYNAISNTTPLTKDLSGPVGLGGFELTFGQDFFLQLQAGEQYNSLSFLGELRWNISSTASVIGSATDSVATPEGNMLNNLSNLTASTSGQLTSAGNIFSSGLGSSLGGFSAQPLGGSSFNQAISRIQRISLGFSDDFEREHLNVTGFASRLTQLSGVFIGPPVNNNWGINATFSHDFTRLMTGSISGIYTNYEELGGNASTYTIDGRINYSLSELTNAYFSTQYLTRDSSQTLQALSPLTSSFNDVRIMIGLTHRFL